MVCSSRLSHLMVTPAQFFPVTVPRSVALSFHRTRSPMLSSLDWSPVIGIAFQHLQERDTAIRPLPAHCSHRAAKILRPGWLGCFTGSTPVPLQARHLTSAIGSLSRFISPPQKAELIPFATARQFV